MTLTVWTYLFYLAISIALDGGSWYLAPGDSIVAATVSYVVTPLAG